MSIIPEDITAVRVDQLANDSITPTSLLAHQVGTELKQDTVQGLINLVATALGTSVGVGYLALSVTDGQQLPDVPETPSFFLCGAGTFLNVNGYANVVCTENLNAVMSLSDHWELAVGIPITAFAPNLQEVTDTGATTDNEVTTGNLTINRVNGANGVINFNYADADGQPLIKFINTDLSNYQVLAIPYNNTYEWVMAEQNGVVCIIDSNNDFADDTAAAAGGVLINQYYHTSGVVKIRLT